MEQQKHLEQMNKMLNVVTTLGMDISILTLGAKLGKDPKELLEGFVQGYEQREPYMAFYYSVSNYGLYVLWKVELLIREIEKTPSFSASPADKALSDLWQAFREYKKLSDEYFNYQYIEKFGPCDPVADIVMDKIKLDVPAAVHRISDLEKQLAEEKSFSAQLQQMVRYREEKLREVGIDL